VRRVSSQGRKERKDFMKKVLLVVALLLLATPVFAADVTVTATVAPEVDINKTSEPNWTRAVTIGWTGAAEANSIRAFALRLDVDSGTNLDNIRSFKRGECNTVSRGYGIFPAKFRQYIDVQNPTTADWQDANYNPLAEWNDPNSGGGNDNPNMVVELGTLFVEPNSPGTSGTLFVVDVNSEGKNDCNLCISLDQIRGGVVKKDTTAADVCLPPGGGGAPAGCVKVLFPRGAIVPNIVGLDAAAADAALLAAQLTTGAVTTKYSDTVPNNVVISQGTAPGTVVPIGTAIDYLKSLGVFPTPSQIIYPKWDADVCVPVYWAGVAGATQYRLERSANSGSTWTATVYTGTATYFGNTVTAAPNYRYRVMAKNADSNSLYLTGTFDCNAYLSTCYRNGATTDPNWTNWVQVGRPDCWCKASTAQEPNGSGYQCDGDIDGLTQGTLDKFRVSGNDLTLLTNNWKKKNSNLTMDPNVIMGGKLKIVGSQCADLDHKTQGTLDKFRVSGNDLTILTNNWKKKSSSTAAGTQYLPGNCPR